MAQAKQQRTDQPSKVSTEDLPRPGDEHVTTSDVDLTAHAEHNKPDKQGAKKKPAAASSKDDDSPNDQDSATGDDNQQKGKPRNRHGQNYRFKKLSRQLAQQTERADTLEQRLLQAESELSNLRASQSPSTPPPKPKQEDYDDPEKWADDLAKWKAQQKKGQQPGSRQQQQPPPRRNPPPPEEHPRDDDIKKWTDRGTKEYGDEFQEALKVKVPISVTMGDYIIDSEHGPALYIHLANNPDEAAKIFKAAPLKAERLLEDLAQRAEEGDLDVPDMGELQVADDDDDDGADDELEETLAGKGKSKKASTAASKAKPTKKSGSRKVSKAPEPPDDSLEGAPEHEVDLDEADMDTYAKVRRAQIKQQRL